MNKVVRGLPQLVSIVAGLALGLSPSSGGAQPTSADVRSVWLQADGSREQGQGVFLNGAKGCLLFTAAHVLTGTESVLYRDEAGAPEQGRVRLRSRLQSDETGAGPKVVSDFGVVEPAHAPARCPDVATAGRIADAVRVGGAGEIIAVSEGGQRRRIHVAVVSSFPRLRVRPLYADENVQVGVSGAPLILDGVVVGLASDVDNHTRVPTITVQRLDDLPLTERAWLFPTETAQGGAGRPHRAPVLPKAWKVLRPDEPGTPVFAAAEGVAQASFGFNSVIRLRLKIAAPQSERLAVWAGATTNRKFMDEWVLTTAAGECHASTASAGGIPLVSSIAERNATAPLVINDSGLVLNAVFSDCRFVAQRGMDASLRIRILARDGARYTNGFLRTEGIRLEVGL